jgi:nicotinamide-nucleotide amidase
VGPSGGTPAKPVGTVCLGWAVKGGEIGATTLRLTGDRQGVRRQAVAYALERALALGLAANR